jgi:exonuclease SbcC
MRPLKLELEGFTAFRQPTCLDFGQLDLFAITGPTGAGKSSLIDAISYALYGRVPRVTAEVGACISQGMERMWVRLEFLAGEERFRVHRETRRKGAPNVRLDQMRDGEWCAVADRAADLTARIVEAVGLDYDGFTRSVILPQGQFQEFLAGAAEKRRSVLRSLLRLDVYERMRVRAGGLAAGLDGRLRGLEHELEGLADATPQSLERLQQDLEERKRDAVRLADATQTLSAAVELAQALNQARERRRGAAADAASTQDELEKAAALLEDGDRQLRQLRERLAAAEAEIAANCFDPERLGALTLALGRAEDLARCLAELLGAEAEYERCETRTAEASAASEKAASNLAMAADRLRVAEEAHQEAQLHNLAAALRRGLKPGDPCPVCGGTVGKLAPVSAEALEAAARRYEAAREAETAAQQAVRAALTALAKAESTAQAAGKRVQDLTAQRSRLAESLEEALPPGTNVSLDGLAEALQVQTAARAERQSLEAEVKAASALLARIDAEVAQARQQLAVLTQRASGAAKDLEAADAAVADSARTLEAIVAKADWPDAASALAAEMDVAPGLRARLAEAQAQQQETTLAIGQTKERLMRLEADMARAGELRKEMQSLKKEHGLADDLAKMLMANRFQAFVQQEALATLAADGSGRLEQLSVGRYRLQLDERGQDFEVLDRWNNDETRSVRTLSGGETFLASLALALALAESLPGLAASRRVVLDSIFLDEGFGSLDAEALDRAADALDALRSENRLVCVVTHLPELAQRLPARVVVTKSESGSSVAVA